MRPHSSENWRQWAVWLGVVVSGVWFFKSLHLFAINLSPPLSHSFFEWLINSQDFGQLTLKDLSVPSHLVPRDKELPPSNGGTNWGYASILRFAWHKLFRSCGSAQTFFDLLPESTWIPGILLRRQPHSKASCINEFDHCPPETFAWDEYFPRRCDHRLGANKCEIGAQDSLTPQVLTRMTNNPRMLHVTVDRW